MFLEQMTLLYMTNMVNIVLLVAPMTVVTFNVFSTNENAKRKFASKFCSDHLVVGDAMLNDAYGL